MSVKPRSKQNYAFRPAPLEPDETRFRQWIVERLTESKWPTARGEDRAVIARKLGVDPSVLDEAEARLAERARAAGVVAHRLGDPSKYREPNYNVRWCELAFPEPVYADWKAFCQAQGMSEGTMLRSLVHTLLSGPRQPRWLSRRWLYRDQIQKMVGYINYRKEGKKWPHVAKTEITRGAEAALVRRAVASNCTQTALMRGQAIDLLEGKLERLIIASTPRAMWDDPDKYWTLDRRPA